MLMTVMYRTNNMRSIWHYPYPCHGSQLLGTPAVSTGPFLARCIAELIGMSVPFSSACVVANVIDGNAWLSHSRHGIQYYVYLHAISQ